MKRDGLVSPGFRSSLIQSKTETADTSLKGGGVGGVTIWRLELQKSDPLQRETTGCLYNSHKFPKDNTVTLSTFIAA